MAHNRAAGRGRRLLPPGGLSTLTFLCLLGTAAARCPAQETAAVQVGRDTPAMASYVEEVEGTLISFTMIPVPGGTVQVSTPDGPRTAQVAPFWMAETETAWKLYDIYVFGLDRRAGTAASRAAAAVSRPSKPYVLPGEHFGHDGHPAIAMTFHAARTFARWLSARTGRTYRLPSEAEWRFACRRAETEPPRPGVLAERAWHRSNARDRTHPVGSLAPNAFGLHDLLGNVAEWVAGADGKPVAVGGAFDDGTEDVHCGARRTRTPAWTATDPQLPKSRWWLSDAPFVGFRLVREPDPPTD